MMITAIFLFSGCSATRAFVDAKAGEYIEKHGLVEKKTSVCYTVLPNKDCPEGFKQYRAKLLPFVPVLESTLCLSVAEDNSATVEGMYCFTKDFIKAD